MPRNELSARPPDNYVDSIHSRERPIDTQLGSSTHFVPITSPPTPAPSPGPSGCLEDFRLRGRSPGLSHAYTFPAEYPIPPHDSPARRQFLFDVLKSCTPSELLYISTSIAPRLKRDFLYYLPPELAIHILGFIDDPRTLARAGQVSKHWTRLVHDEFVWKRMCMWYGFDDWPADDVEERRRTRSSSAAMVKPIILDSVSRSMSDTMYDKEPAYPQSVGAYIKPKLSSNYQHFKLSHMTMMNWRHGGRMLRSHRMPFVTPDSGVITSLAIDKEWVVVGLVNSRILVFSAQTGVLHRTLVGHESGVWSVCLVSRGGYPASSPQENESRLLGCRGNTNQRIRELNSRLSNLDIDGTNSNSGPSLVHTLPLPLRHALGLDEDNNSQPRSVSPSNSSGSYGDQCYASKGWGQPHALVVSGGCDKVLRVWDIESGLCIYELRGHTSTIRCIRVLDNRPIAVTGSRDATLRVWDIQRGKMLRVLEGHAQSVRCLDVCGNRAVSGSYDTTCRLWNIDTGECLHVLRGHFHQIYSVAFDGVRIASGGLDTTVRVWDANTGQCMALLQGHTALVCQLQLSPTILATGGSDGRVITFSLDTYSVLHRIAAHDSSVTSLQFDKNFLVTGGNDGRVRLFEMQTGNHIRELSDPSESVWKVAYGKETYVVMCKRAGHSVMEIWSTGPKET
ncbi:hypothetical protein AX15_005407 [Amanita polypyramis BW_CC]|nr:hypothetical protein AX15_005407 [Amanita polypyramis BW_CC]